MQRCAAGCQRACLALLRSCLLALSAVSGSLADGAAANLEYEVKAVFLLRIAQFTDWPPRPALHGDFTFCVVGDSPLGKLLDDAVRGERVADRPAAVRRIAPSDDAAGCELLFIPASAGASAPRILAKLRSAPVLTVGDFPGFVGHGGAIELYVEGGYVRFRVDRAAARAAGLDLRSQLLRAAADVKED